MKSINDILKEKIKLYKINNEVIKIEKSIIIIKLLCNDKIEAYKYNKKIKNIIDNNLYFFYK